MTEVGQQEVLDAADSNEELDQFEAWHGDGHAAAPPRFDDDDVALTRHDVLDLPTVQPEPVQAQLDLLPPLLGPAPLP